MEKVLGQEQTQEVFENDIAMYLKLFCEEQGIEDMKKESQSVWNAALMYIKRHVFNVPGILKMSKPLDGYNNNNIYLNNSNCNSYDINKVNGICDYYIYLCMMYDKEVSINGFTFLTGISDTVIYEWGADEGRKLSTASSAIYKKLNQYREESLSSKLATANKNPVGILAILNRHYQWNMPGVREERPEKRALSLKEAPKIGLNADGMVENSRLSELPNRNG